MNGWSERRLFLISAGALASCSISLRLLTRASAQTLAFTASDPGSLSKLVETTPQWQAMVADVAFFHSWRLELRPLDYEGRPGFVQEMAQNRAQIFGARPQFISLLAQAGPGLMAERENFISVYNQRRERYERFLEEIGIIPRGKAGQRMTDSLFLYANLFFVRLGKAALDVARRETYIWPFC